MAASSYHLRILSPKYEQTLNVKPLTTNRALPFAVRLQNLDLQVSNVVDYRSACTRQSRDVLSSRSIASTLHRLHVSTTSLNYYVDTVPRSLGIAMREWTVTPRY